MDRLLQLVNRSNNLIIQHYVLGGPGLRRVHEFHPSLVSHQVLITQSIYRVLVMLDFSLIEVFVFVHLPGNK